MSTKPSIRCSGLDRQLACFGARILDALRLSQTVDLGDEMEGDETTWAGNWCHYQAALALVNEYGAEGELQPPRLPEAWEPSKWDYAMVRWYLTGVLESIPEDWIILVENEFRHEFDRFELTGHLDLCAISPDGTEACIDDLKTGRNEVDVADENWQLLGYAILLWLKYRNLKKITFRIRQKYATLQISEGFLDDLANAAAFLERKINESLDNEMLLDTGYKQCRLCPNCEFCPAIDAHVKAVKYQLSELDLKTLAACVPSPKLGMLANECRALSGPIKKITDAFTARVKSAGSITLEDGTVVTTKEVDGFREITDPASAFNLAVALLKDRVDSAVHPDPAMLVWKTVSISLSELEAVFVDAAGMQKTTTKADKESADKLIERSFKHLVTRPKQTRLVWGV